MAGRRPPFSAWVRSHAQLRRGLVKGDAQQPIWDGFFWHVSGSFKLDAVVKGPRSSSFTLDAVIVARRFTLDAQIYKPQTFPLPGPRALIRSVSQVALQPIWKTFFWSQVTEIQLSYIKGFTLDATVRSARQGTFTLDALALAHRTGSVTFDAIRAASRTNSFTLDAALVASRSGSFTLDATHRANITSSFTLDAVIPGIAGSVFGSFTLDAVIKKTLFEDDFNRTVPSGWGNDWVSSGDASVDGAVGEVPIGASSGFSNPDIPPAPDWFDLQFDFRTEDISGSESYDTGQGIELLYGFYLYLYVWPSPTSSPVSYTIGAESLGGDQDLDTSTWYTIRIQKADATRKIKIWRQSDPEPEDWTWISDGRYSAYADFSLGINGGVNSPTQVDNLKIWTTGSFGGSGNFTLDAEIYQPNFTLDAEICQPNFTLDAVITGSHTGSFDLSAIISPAHWLFDAVIRRERRRAFPLEAFISAPTHAGSFTLDAEISILCFTLDAWIVNYALTSRSSFHLDAFIVGTRGSFTLDAQISAPATNTSGFTFDAYLSGTYRLFSTKLDAIIRRTSTRAFMLSALIVEPSQPFTFDAIISAPAPSGYFLLDSMIKAETDRSFTLDAYISSSRFFLFSLDALIVGTIARSFTLDAAIAIPSASSFTLNAVIGGHAFTLDAYIRGPRSFTLDAYIRRTAQVVFPPGGGTPVGTYATDPTNWPTVAILVGNNDGTGMVDITDDVIWSQTWFEQVARVGPGQFEIVIRGTRAYQGGERVYLLVDEFRQFAGWVQQVSYGHLVPNKVSPKTVLDGTSFDILFDRSMAFNKAGNKKTEPHGGSYAPIPSWPRNTMDGDLIKKFVRNYLELPPEVSVDNVENVANVTPNMPGSFTTGDSFRTFMQGNSIFTQAVWWFDQYMGLHNHNRSTLTAPFEISDGTGGVSCVNLQMTQSIDSMKDDTIVWGVEARDVTGKITYDREEFNAGWLEEHWRIAISDTKGYIANLEAVADPTPDQVTELAYWRNWLVVYQRDLADAIAHPGPGSIEKYGRWQWSEWNADMHLFAHVRSRARIVLLRWAQPVWKATCRVYEHGLSAGMVTTVSSANHGFSLTLILVKQRISFYAGGFGRGVPQYDLEFGLEPDSAWSFYDALPFGNVVGSNR